ncbi:hypothetical protein [Hyphomicrobium sp.]|uniref:hypothetical protein n=1 Tax=Hyphomicrobium sp. TaxID=82 RepID=UPI0013213950|nr:hypothetical protein [Hyphomicrobium sp.]KAB2937394.1 MAG: hypothetical protein F9K20_20085 [Hyphomicrobium sp.]
MSTARSPLRKLKAEADNIAARLKALARGEVDVSDPAGKVAAARAKESITFGVVMDDKILKIEMPWATIRELSEAGISAWILKHMREQRDVVH